MVEVRVRSRIPATELQAKVGRILDESDHNIRLTGPTRVFAPDGRPMAVYLPGALLDYSEAVYPILTTIRGTTENRGLASGTDGRHTQNNLQRALPVMSSIIGSFEASGFYKFCRLTSWTAKETEARWPQLLPYFGAIADAFEAHVPERFEAQMAQVRKTPADWIVPGTPFTTVTVNSTFPTGVHQDAGDLDEGFSCLAVMRRGPYTGGLLTFPEYRIAVDLQDGDLLLMNAHDWHGNTRMVCGCGVDLAARAATEAKYGPCETCGAERISVVAYFRTKMVRCGSAQEEQQKQVDWAERVNQTGTGALT